MRKNWRLSILRSLITMIKSKISCFTRHKAPEIGRPTRQSNCFPAARVVFNRIMTNEVSNAVLQSDFCPKMGRGNAIKHGWVTCVSKAAFIEREKPVQVYLPHALSPISLGINSKTAGGQSWTGHQKSSMCYCHLLTFHTANAAWLYEGGGTGGETVLRSDAGPKWSHTKGS